ncbi:hypothetical protein ACCO45_010380 [Purpureocillium lilacinum]|uniref:Uncharacterized protein n=1 Tax=Purpureocillium lilacinum TaxID=33203 RepID=A0ACC4DEM6_PURLI
MLSPAGPKWVLAFGRAEMRQVLTPRSPCPPTTSGGKAALITGGGSGLSQSINLLQSPHAQHPADPSTLHPGINLAFAQLLLESGCSVIIGDLALQPEAQALVDKYTPPPPPPAPPSSLSTSDPSLDSTSSSDPSSSSSPRALFHRTDRHQPGLALARRRRREPGAFAALGVNLVAPMRLAQLALAHWTRSGMITAGGGGAGGGNPSFIAVSSIAGHTASPTYPFYFASKHGLHGFIRSMGMLRDAVGVRFGAVAPGAVKTRIFDADPSKAALSAGTVSWIPAPDVAAAMLRPRRRPGPRRRHHPRGPPLGLPRRALFNADPPEALDQMLPALRGEVRLLAERLASGEFAV